VRFDLAAHDSTRTVLRRSLTAGPGEYDLLVGWADPRAKDPAATVRVLRRRVVLPPASTTDFSLSTVIVASDVAVRETPPTPAEQTARPYTIGTLDISPASDDVFTTDERLALVLQVINARGGVTGKPDVSVGYRVFRAVAAREEIVGTVPAQRYDESTLPRDFDSAKKHPLFAAVAIPLRTFRRGTYRVEIAAMDRIAGVGATTHVTFVIAPTAEALLREAPPVAAPFSRKDLLDAVVVAELLRHVERDVSSTYRTALEAVRESMPNYCAMTS
jgi:hypothetical protein